MIKLLGSMVVLGAGAWLGFIKKEELASRVKYLQQTENALLYMKNQIEVGSVPLDRLFAQSEFALFKRAAEYIKLYGVCEGFKKAVLAAELPAGERAILFDFAQGLGAQDREGQLANIRACTLRIAEIKRAAYEKKARLSGLYAVSGILGGALVVLIFL